MHHRGVKNRATPFDPSRRQCLLGATALGGLLAGCASPGPDGGGAERLANSVWAQATVLEGVVAAAPWSHRRYGNRAPTVYRADRKDGRPALHALSESGNSLLRLPLQPQPLAPGARLHFSWWVPALLPQADIRAAEADDAVVRVLLTFDGDRASWTRRDHMLSELAHLVGGEPLPYATLMYVWDNRYPMGSVIDNPHTRRIRKLVVQNGPKELSRWVDHERDIRADFLRAFGTEPGALTGVGVMTDSNNTRTNTEAWYGPIAVRAPT